MHCSLLNRFQGMLLGANLGLVLAQSAQLYPHWWLWYSLSAELDLLPLLPLVQHWSEVLIRGDSELLALSVQPSDLSVTAFGLTLPLGLYYHDQPTQLEQQIQVTLAAISATELEPAAVAVNQAIAAILQERSQPAELIPDLLATGQPPSSFSQCLLQMQHLQAEYQGLDQAIAAVADTEPVVAAVGLGFYTYLSTPTDVRLTLLRAIQTSPQAELTALIAGALAGAEQGWTEIPIGWRLPTQPEYPQAILSLAERLLAAWSGCDPARYAGLDTLAVSAPGVMRPR
jgi:ADP-ribosylglycohydrolase